MGESGREKVTMSLQRVPDPIEALLAFLDADPHRAGEKYAALQQLLAKFFEWREAAPALDLADRTLDRVGEKIAAGARIESLNSYCRRVAYFIYLEWLNRQPEHKNVPIEEVAQLSLETVAAGVAELEAQRRDCQQDCLSRLPGGTRGLLREYFAGAGRARIERRERMAKQEGIGMDALYNRVTRLLRKLRECERACLQKLLS
jgi:hypothetical protein